MAILVFAGVLSVPSAVFAEASWYGSLRTGVMSSNSKVSVFDGGSRWGVRGSHEAGEGLTAIYRFEHKMSTENAGMKEGRLAYVGLSGGFGTVTAGQIWSAAFNSVGAITDNSWHNGDSQTTYRHGQVVSYAFSNDLMAMQLDLQYSAPHGQDPQEKDLTKTEFGLTVNVGDIGKVAVAHTNQPFVLRARDNTGWKVKTNSVAAEISVSDLRVYAGSQKEKSTYTPAYGLTDGEPNTTLSTAPDANAGGTEIEQKTTFFGFGGSLADTGISYLFQWRDIKDDRKPWILGIGKSLGGGASINLEHSNVDEETATRKDSTRLNLQVNF